MKKRLLALALCLVMATSLLPVTAFALTDDDIIGIRDQGRYCGDTYFTLAPSVASSVFQVMDTYDCVVIYPDINGRYSLPREPATHKIEFSYYGDNGITTRGLDVNILNHDWQFTQTENSLTATCRNPEQYKNEGGCKCSVGEVSLTLDAHSVTLPDSPFNARVILNGITEEQIKEEFGYTISPIRYKFKAPGDSSFTEITPADGAREGTYQAAVTLTPLYPQASYALNEDGATNQGPIFGNDGSITLYTQYTAVNPEVTAQTGDNRPIELMMAGAVLFSALAAAAFILDNKRKYRQ